MNKYYIVIGINGEDRKIEETHKPVAPDLPSAIVQVLSKYTAEDAKFITKVYGMPA